MVRVFSEVTTRTAGNRTTLPHFLLFFNSFDADSYRSCLLSNEAQMVYDRGMFFRTQHVYLDHAAATPPDPQLARAACDLMVGKYANPGGIHGAAAESAALLESARTTAAALLHASPSEITFTRGGTESCNMAVTGTIDHIYAQTNRPARVLVYPLEHPATLEPILHAVSAGKAQLVELPIDIYGRVELSETRQLMSEFNPDVLVCQYANSEIGTVQPIAELGKMILAHRKSTNAAYPYFICDAIQAFQYETPNVLQLHVDMMILSGSKIYGPRSAALLYKKRTITIDPIFQGGGQEQSLRPGTTDPASAQWLVSAMQSADNLRTSESSRLRTIAESTVADITVRIPGVLHNGHPELRIPNNINISIPGVDSEYVVLALDHAGFAVSSQSACSAKSGARSRVVSRIAQLRSDPQVDYGDIRITMGRSTTAADMKRFVESLAKIVSDWRSWNPTV